jgi:hypothetical protein
MTTTKTTKTFPVDTTKGDLVTLNRVKYVVTSTSNGVHGVKASTCNEAGNSGSTVYLGSLAAD